MDKNKGKDAFFNIEIAAIAELITCNSTIIELEGISTVN